MEKGCPVEITQVSADTDYKSSYEYLLELEEHYSAHAQEKRRMLTKIDLRLLPYLSFCYLWCTLDKSNAGNAKLFGFLTDTNMTGEQFNLALTCLFFTYGLFEPVSNIALKRVGPRLWVPSMMVIWGVVALCTAFVKNWHQYIGIRLCLGAAESVIYPGSYFILSCWYTRSELQTRMGIFYGANTLAGAFGGVLAYGIGNLDYARGWRAWRWLFLIEGVATVFVALIGYVMLPNFPGEDKIRFFSDKELDYLYLRKKYDNGPAGTNQKFEMSQAWNALKDPQVYFVMLMFWFGGSVPTYSLSYTLPTMVKNLGYSAIKAQAMTTPPYVAATILTVSMAIWADRSQQRARTIMICYTIGLMGIIILWITVHHPNLPGVSYFAIFLAASGYNAQAPGIGAWLSLNIPNPTKRASAIGFMMLLGSIGGGGIGSNIYIDSQAPYYPLGFGFSVGCTVLGAMVPCMCNYFYLRSQNKKRDALSQEEIDKFSLEELAELGDRAPTYRYVL
ncbi:hypothetical protein KL938_003817 [Ogataea parapolymorpha]|nr:hypothetical protein KL938_003817 [Ogataea parapolymorpha]